MKKNKKEELYKEVKELRYNKDLSIKELAQYYGKSERTIYRWLQKGREQTSNRPEPSKKQRTRSRKYPKKNFRRIIELKKEIPERSAPMVHRHLEEEFKCLVPSISTVRKYIKAQGLTTDHRMRSSGYKRFQREKLSDFWQIDT